jgi:hypothetical protein
MRAARESEKEVVTGGDDDNVVVLGVNLLQEGDGAPASS